MASAYQPVENPALAALLERYGEGQTPEAGQAALQAAQDAVLLAPLAPGVQAAQDADTRPAVRPLQDSGKSWLPVFTDWGQLAKSCDPNETNALTLPFAGCAALVLAEESGLDGLLLNPGGSSLPVPRATLAGLYPDAQPLPPPAAPQVLAAEEYEPTRAFAGMTKKILRTLREVKTAWMLIYPPEGDDARLLMIVESDGPTDALETVTAELAPLAPKKPPFGCIAHNSSEGRKLTEGQEPLYTRLNF